MLIQLPKLRVAGSIPVVRSKKAPQQRGFSFRKADPAARGLPRSGGRRLRRRSRRKGTVPLLRPLGLTCVVLCATVLVTGCGGSPEETSAAAPNGKTKADRIEEEMHAWLVAASEQGLGAAPKSVTCTKSKAFERVGAIDDFHNCTVVSTDGSAELSCVLSRGERIFDGSVPGSCEDAKAGGWGEGAFRPQPAPPTAEEARWALQAEAVCGTWAERQIEAIGTLDEERLHEDFSYVWRVLRPVNAGIVQDLA